MKTAVFSSLGAVTLVALGGLWFFQPAKAHAPKRAPTAEAAEPDVAPAVPLHERRSFAQPGEPVMAPAPAEKVEEPPPEPTPSIEEARVEYENQFDSERGRSALRRLETVVVNAAARIAVPGSQIDKVECRDSICKMNLKFDNPDVDHQFFQKLTHLEDRSEDTKYLESFDIIIPDRTTAADGKVHAQAYLKRPTFAE